MNTTFTGVVRTIGELQQVLTQRGETLNKREILLETEEEFPQSLHLELVNDRAVNFDAMIGQTITVYLRFTTSMSQNGRVFNNIRCWRISLEGGNG